MSLEPAPRKGKFGVETCVVTSLGVHSPTKRKYTVRSRVLMESSFTMIRSSSARI